MNSSDFYRSYTRIPLRTVSLYIIPVLIILSSCNRDRNNPGYQYFNDMTQSEAYKYYSENPAFADRLNKRITVNGTIPMGFVPYTYPKTVEGQKNAGQELVNPVTNSRENIKAGKEKFEIFCAMCHGETGDGKGYLVTTKKFKKDVTSLIGDFVQNKPDGEIYHVITLGSVSGFMGSHSGQLNPDDRWRIVRYIKARLQVPDSLTSISKGL